MRRGPVTWLGGAVMHTTPWRILAAAAAVLLATSCATDKRTYEEKESLAYSCLSPALTLTGEVFEAEFREKFRGEDIRYAQSCREHHSTTTYALDFLSERGLVEGILMSPIMLTGAIVAEPLSALDIGAFEGTHKICDEPELLAKDTFAEDVRPPEGKFVGTLTVVNERDPTDQYVRDMSGPASAVAIRVRSSSDTYLVALNGHYSSDTIECDVDEQVIVQPGT